MNWKTDGENSANPNYLRHAVWGKNKKTLATLLLFQPEMGKTEKQKQKPVDLTSKFKLFPQKGTADIYIYICH